MEIFSQFVTFSVVDQRPSVFFLNVTSQFFRFHNREIVPRHLLSLLKYPLVLKFETFSVPNN